MRDGQDKSASERGPPEEGRRANGATSPDGNSKSMNLEDWAAEVCEMHFSGVFRLIRGSGLSVETSEDIAQDIFLILCQAMKSGHPVRNIWPWLKAVVRKKVADEFRRRKRVQVLITA